MAVDLATMFLGQQQPQQALQQGSELEQIQQMLLNPQRPEQVEAENVNPLQVLLAGLSQALTARAGLTPPDLVGQIRQRRQAEADRKNRRNDQDFAIQRGAQERRLRSLEQQRDRNDQRQFSEEQELGRERRRTTREDALLDREEQAASEAMTESLFAALEDAKLSDSDLKGLDLNTPEGRGRARGIASRVRAEREIAGRPKKPGGLSAGALARLDEAESIMIETLESIEADLGNISSVSDPESIRKRFETMTRRRLRQDPARVEEMIAEFESTVGIAIDDEILRREKAAADEAAAAQTAEQDLPPGIQDILRLGSHVEEKNEEQRRRRMPFGGISRDRY